MHAQTIYHLNQLKKDSDSKKQPKPCRMNIFWAYFGMMNDGHAFGRSIAEVGAVSIVGGNIQWKTRVMTTAIMLETNKGKFSFALALGIILLLIAFIVNAVSSLAVKETKDD